MSNLEVSIQETGAVITIDPDPLPNVIGDDVQLIQLFQNLVGNSIKFAKSGMYAPSEDLCRQKSRKQPILAVFSEGTAE
ncbi:MAG: hypothetical protein R3F19_09020 [Verrucomicrobiales bacterium]